MKIARHGQAELLTLKKSIFSEGLTKERDREINPPCPRGDFSTRLDFSFLDWSYQNYRRAMF